MKNKIILFALAGLVLAASAIYYFHTGSSRATTVPDSNKNGSGFVPVSAPASAATNPNTLTRAKAESMITAYLKQKPEVIGLADSWLEERRSNLSCPYGSANTLLFFDPAHKEGDLAQLEKDGLVQRGSTPAQDYFTLTEKVRPYIVNFNYSKEAGPAILVARAETVKVTGLVHRADNLISADFSAANKLTVFGELCAWPAAQSGVAVFTLYDDGWRITNVE